MQQKEERAALATQEGSTLSFKEALEKLGISEYGERIFNSNSRGELMHLVDYIQLAQLEDMAWFKDWFKDKVTQAEKSWTRPESVFQHMLELFSSEGYAILALRQSFREFKQREE